MALSRGSTNLGSEQLVNARRTESIDAASITKLVGSTTEQVFGRVNVVNMIERANLGVSLVNQSDELLGHASFFDYPNIPEAPIGEWESWLKQYVNLPKTNTINTLFMHLFVAREEYSHGAVSETMTTVFNAVPDVHYIYLLVPKSAYPESTKKESALSQVFTEVDLDGSVGLDSYVLFQCKREKFVPMLHVRQARVQDHDDLTPIFDRQCGMLSETYGDFYLAELIEAQDDSMHCLVAEIDGTAVGFMSLCSEVNVGLLNKCFDLGPVHGLRKPHSEDKTMPSPPTPPKTPVESIKSAPASNKDDAEPEATTEDMETAEPTAETKVIESKEEKRARKKKEKEDQANEDAWTEHIYGIAAPSSVSTSRSSSLSTSRSSSVADKPESVMQEAAAQDRNGTELRLGHKPCLPKPAPKFKPEYYGESNAFSVQMFCIDEKYEMRSMDLLREAFVKMPGKDFAIMTVPHLVPEFPLLQKFTRVTPQLSSTLSQELYIFHKMGLTEAFKVRDAKNSDYESIARLVERLALKDNLLADLKQYNLARRDNDGIEIRAYVAEVGAQIVGIAIIRREEQIEYLRSHYNIEDFIYFNHHARTEHGHLHHMALNPIFSHYTKHFLKEVMRKSYKTSLYYPIYPPHSTDTEVNRHSWLTCMGELVPVRARRQIIYPRDILEDRAPSERVLQKQSLYALCHINRKLTLEPKVVINARIVVVGASTVSLAFLETLVYCPHLKFNNLILISPHGLPGELPPDALRDSLLGSEHCYNPEDHANIALRSWVNVVYGKMTKIDRTKKQVYVGDDKIVSYDHLIIACGTQHQIPSPNSAKSEATISTRQPNPNSWFVGEQPKNLLIVNDEYDAAVALYWMEQNIIRPTLDGKVVVHGNSLRVHSTIDALVKLGVKPDKIILVKAPEDGIRIPRFEEDIIFPIKPSCFNNPMVETAVSQALQKYGTTVVEDAELMSWSIKSNQINKVCFMTPEGPFEPACAVMFAYTSRRVDLNAFQALNDACLVFDGRLVIDSTFHTNDVSIRAAGPITKYQRRYHADEWTHAVFNSKEIGVELASALLTLFDPTLEPLVEAEGSPLKLIPLYKSPKVQAARLPGDLHYLHVAKPSLPVPLAIHMMNPDYGVVLSTGEPVGKSAEDEDYVSRYFRLHFNTYNTVETITCLSKKPIDESNILCLYGAHEKFLNSVKQRYSEKLIPDFFTYLREAWSLALYHDRFAEFRDEIRELLVNQPASDVRSLESKVRELIDEDLQLSKGQRNTLSGIYADSGIKRAVETRILGFLNYNYYHLPMYAKPGMV